MCLYIDIYNRYVLIRDSYAAYPETELSREQFEKLLSQARIIISFNPLATNLLMNRGFLSRPLRAV
jgi:hypothetical protein